VREGHRGAWWKRPCVVRCNEGLGGPVTSGSVKVRRSRLLEESKHARGGGSAQWENLKPTVRGRGWMPGHHVESERLLRVVELEAADVSPWREVLKESYAHKGTLGGKEHTTPCHQESDGHSDRES